MSLRICDWIATHRGPPRRRNAGGRGPSILVDSKEPDVKGSWGSGLLGAISALVTALAGRHWWAVALTLLSALGMTYGAVCWLASRPNSGSIKIGPIEWRASSDHQVASEAQTLQVPRRKRLL